MKTQAEIEAMSDAELVNRLYEASVNDADAIALADEVETRLAARTAPAEVIARLDGINATLAKIQSTMPQRKLFESPF